MRAKLTLSLSAIAAILLISSIISVMEYRSMSSYVSDLIADDISSINVARQLGDMSNSYNLEILAVIGNESVTALPEFDDAYFLSHCDTLRSSMASNTIKPLADSVVYSYSSYMLTALELQDVLLSDFIDSRAWYFDRLQPRYDRLNHDINHLSSAIYADLEKNSATFESGFYRSIIPGIVAVGVGLLLVIMLLVFLLSYYVKPIYRMLDALKNYRSLGKRYNVTFDGDDQLSELNEGITDLVGENLQLRDRIRSMRAKAIHTEEQE